MRRFVFVSLATVGLAVGVAACGGDSSGLSEQAQRGKTAAANRGCTGCHGANGQGGVGPSWIDLAGSERVLIGGSTVIADDAYLLRSITDPGAEEVDGFNVKMALNPSVTADEAADIVQYIKELTSEGTSE